MPCHLQRGISPHSKSVTLIFMKVENDHRSKFSNISNWEEDKPEKVRASLGFEPVTSTNTGVGHKKLKCIPTHLS